MKTRINKEEMRREWIINRWYEKVFYIVGVAYVSLFAIGFIVGLVLALATS